MSDDRLTGRNTKGVPENGPSSKSTTGMWLKRAGINQSFTVIPPVYEQKERFNLSQFFSGGFMHKLSTLSGTFSLTCF